MSATSWWVLEKKFINILETVGIGIYNCFHHTIDHGSNSKQFNLETGRRKLTYWSIYYWQSDHSIPDWTGSGLPKKGARLSWSLVTGMLFKPFGSEYLMRMKIGTATTMTTGTGLRHWKTTYWKRLIGKWVGVWMVNV